MKDTPPVSDAEMTRVLAVEGMGFRQIPINFDPLNDPADMLLLIDAMRERHNILLWRQNYADGSHGCDAITATPYMHLVATVKTDTPQRAVALAAYQALEGE